MLPDFDRADRIGAYWGNPGIRVERGEAHACGYRGVKGSETMGFIMLLARKLVDEGGDHLGPSDLSQRDDRGV
jgi:hypothetical protein